jgi:tetratricopeptide (TPR) repeat protein
VAIFEEALAIERNLENPDGVASALRGLGRMEFYRGNLRRSQSLFEEALEISRGQENLHSVAFALSGLRDVALHSGDVEGARSLYREGLEVSRELDSKPGIAYLLHHLGDVGRKLGDLEDARVHYSESLRLLEELGNKRRIAMTLAGFAALAVAESQDERAARLLGAIETLREDSGTVMPPLERKEHQSQIAAARRSMSNEAFERLFSEGRRMSMKAAIAEALG